MSVLTIRIARAALALAGFAQLGTSYAASCSAASPPHRVPLVELYTSEGCDSCPPADRWLGALASKKRDDVVLLALHVDYWDNLGWKDRFARADFSERQHVLSHGGPSNFVYTPEIFVGGREVRGWSSGAVFEDRVAGTAQRPSSADLKIDVQRSGDTIKVTTRVALKPDVAEPKLFIALVEDGLSTQVRGGENRGATLHHDRVVRAWSGALPINAPQSTLERELSIAGDADRAHLGIVAFVQDARSGEVAQALQVPLAACLAQ